MDQSFLSGVLFGRQSSPKVGSQTPNAVGINLRRKAAMAAVGGVYGLTLAAGQSPAAIVADTYQLSQRIPVVSTVTKPIGDVAQTLNRPAIHLPVTGDFSLDDYYQLLFFIQ